MKKTPRIDGRLCGLVVLLSSVACATPGLSAGPKVGAAGYSKGADDLYQSARRSLVSGDYLGASNRFQELRSKFAFTDYAALAELGIGDTLYAEGKHLEAAEAFRAFVRARPSHREADYAAYRIAQSLAEEAPSNFFLFPPSYEKDLGEVKQAVAALRSFQTTYPDSDHRPEADALLKTMLRRLADHELYVAGFYRRKGEWQGVAGRLEGLLRDYPGVGLDTEAQLGLAEAYLRMEPPQNDKALALITEAEKQAEAGSLATKARRLRARLEALKGATSPMKEAGNAEAAGPATGEASSTTPPTESKASVKASPAGGTAADSKER